MPNREYYVEVSAYTGAQPDNNPSIDDAKTLEAYAYLVSASTGQLLTRSSQIANEMRPYERGTVERILFNIAYDQEQYEQARGHLQKAIDSGGLNATQIDEARYQSAQLYIQEEKWREGAAALESADRR